MRRDLALKSEQMITGLPIVRKRELASVVIGRFRCEAKFGSDECFSVTFLCAALHSSEARQPSKCLAVKPVLRSLGAEVRLQKINFSFQIGRSNWNE